EHFFTLAQAIDSRKRFRSRVLPHRSAEHRWLREVSGRLSAAKRIFVKSLAQTSNKGMVYHGAKKIRPGKSMQKIRVILADDHTVVRQGLRALLMAEGDIDIVGEAENGRQAVQVARKLEPDVAVVDIAMPQLNGLEATRQITRLLPSTKVLILSSYSDDEY